MRRRAPAHELPGTSACPAALAGPLQALLLLVLLRLELAVLQDLAQQRRLQR